MTAFMQSRFRSATADPRHRPPLRNRGWRAAPATGYRSHAVRLLRSQPRHQPATRTPAPTATTEHNLSQTHPAQPHRRQRHREPVRRGWARHEMHATRWPRRWNNWCVLQQPADRLAVTGQDLRSRRVPLADILRACRDLAKDTQAVRLEERATAEMEATGRSPRCLTTGGYRFRSSGLSMALPGAGDGVLQASDGDRARM